MGSDGGAFGVCARCLQVLDEIGVDLSAAMQSAPNKRVAQASSSKQQQGEEEAVQEDMDELASRLANLKG